MTPRSRPLRQVGPIQLAHDESVEFNAAIQASAGTHWEISAPIASPREDRALQSRTTKHCIEAPRQAVHIADSDEAGHAFQFEAGRGFRSEGGHPWRRSRGSTT